MTKGQNNIFKKSLNFKALYKSMGAETAFDKAAPKG